MIGHKRVLEGGGQRKSDEERVKERNIGEEEERERK